jgi:RHS repeat-associated protein
VPYRVVLTFVVSFLFFPFAASPQDNLAINWTHSWGGTSTDTGNGVATDSAGNVYVTGSTTSFGAGGQDVLLLKYDPSGNLKWARTWGGPNNDNGVGVLAGNDGSVYVVGNTNSYGAGWYDVLVLKFDTNGNLLWSHTWGGGSFDVGYDLSFDQNGNLAIAAESYSFGEAVALLKLTPDGTFVSATTWKGPATYNSGYSITVDANGNTIITGTSWDYSVFPNHNTILVLKFDSAGNFVWNRNWAGPSEDEASGRKVVRTDAQGNIYVLGHTSASCTTSDFSLCIFDTILLKVDPSGNLIWARKWGGTGSETPGGLWLDANNQLDVAATTTSFNGGLQSALLQQYDGNGNVLASKVLSTTASGWNSLTVSNGGTLIASGGGPNNSGVWQDTGIASVVAPGSLSAPASSIDHPTGSFGSPTGTTTDPSGVIDVGGGGMDALTSSFSFGGASVIPQPPPPPTGNGPAQSSTSQQASIAEPVSTGSGNYSYAHTDFSIPTRGTPLIFQRFYNSIDNFAGPLGANWNHGYDILLGQTAAGVATIRWGDGHGETYTLTSGVYVPQAGVSSTLVANADHTFTLTEKNQSQYTFSEAGRLTEIDDKNGNTTQLTYDASGNLITISAPEGRSLTLAYDAQGRIVSVTDPMGHTESYGYDGANDLVRANDPVNGVTTYAYDASHHVTQITLPNGNTLLKNAYDAQGRVISQTNGRGFTWQFAYNTPAARQTTITDARGAVTVHTYDSSLRIVSILDPLSHTTSYAYDSNNDRTSITNPNGKTTAFTYDGNGNVTSVTDPLSDKTAFTYDATSDLLSVTNPKSQTTGFSYDSHGNLTSIQDALGDKTTLTHDSSGKLTGKTDAKGNATSFSYGGAGDLTGITDALGNSTALAYDGDGRLVSVTNPNSHTATSAYDALGRLTKVADPLGHQTAFAYDAVGNLLSVTDANGHTTSYAYDATNNLSTVTDALGHVTKYLYDQDNNRVGFTNAKGNTTTYQYDALNRLISTADPLSFATAYSYDPVGNVAAVTDAKGQTNRFAYDALNRLLSIAYADHKNVAYSYDADGNRTSMVDWTGTTAYAYDALDRLTSVTFPGSKTVAYSYDTNGRRESLTYPDGKSVAYNYDADERLSTVTDWLSHTAQYAYDAAGNLLREQYPNKAHIDFAYDAANRLTAVVNTTVGVPPLAFNYTLDAVGNRTMVKEAGVPTSYGYDANNQLTSAQTWFFKATWTYDPVGNRLRETSPFGIANYTYDASDRLLKAGTRTYTYDADGNQTSATEAFMHLKRTYTFDAANRLVSVDGGLTSAFVYDGDGNRIRQSAGDRTQTYVNDVAAALPVVLQDAYSTGSPSSYVYGLNLIEAFQGRDNDFYQYDGLGSVIQLTDAAGRPEISYLYDAWGNLILPAPLTNPFRFTGQALDVTTGLYYLRARYYDAQVGRFISKDPFGGFVARPLSQNKFIYAIDRPTLASDPTGLCSCAASGSSILNQFVSNSTSLTNANSTVSLAATELTQNQPSTNALPSPSDVAGEVVDELPALVPAIGELVSYFGASYGSSALISSGIALISPEAVVLATGVTVLYELGPVAFAPIPVAH